MTSIDRSHYKECEYSLEEIQGKWLHIVFGLSSYRSYLYCDEDQAVVARVTKLAVVIDMNQRIESLRQHLELHFYRPKHQSFSDLHLPGEEVVLIPLHRVTIEEKYPYYGQREDDRSQTGTGSGSDSREEEEVPGGQQA